MEALKTPDKHPLKTIREDEGVALGMDAFKRGLHNIPSLQLRGLQNFPSLLVGHATDPVQPGAPFDERPLKTIREDEGVSLVKDAFKRGQGQTFRMFLLDHITDPVQPRSYPPNAGPDEPGRRRLHPLLVSAIVCFGLLFALFIYFSFWR